VDRRDAHFCGNKKFREVSWKFRGQEVSEVRKFRKFGSFVDTEVSEVSWTDGTLTFVGTDER
jgi:hypothetical protein